MWAFKKGKCGQRRVFLTAAQANFLVRFNWFGRIILLEAIPAAVDQSTAASSCASDLHLIAGSDHDTNIGLAGFA